MRPKFNIVGRVTGYTITLDEVKLLHKVLTQEPRTELQEQALHAFFGGEVNY